MGPWRITIPLENAATPNASVTLALSTDPWTYAQVAPVSAYKTPGSRTIVLQVCALTRSSCRLHRMWAQCVAAPSCCLGRGKSPAVLPEMCTHRGRSEGKELAVRGLAAREWAWALTLVWARGGG